MAQPPQPWDYIAKIVSLGDSGSGKSSVRPILLSPIYISLSTDNADDDS